MKDKAIEWPWNRPWVWVLFIITTFVVAAPILLFRIRGCGRYITGNDTDTACTMQPLLGTELTWIVGLVSLGLLIRFTIGLATAISYTHRARESRQ